MATRLVLLLLSGATLSLCSSHCNTNCTKKELWIGAFLTVDTSAGGWNSAGVIPAMEMAIEDVNNDSNLLNNYTLRVTWRDTKCNRGYGFRQLVDFIQLPRDKTPIMLIGGGCSVGTEATAEASHYWNLVQIAYSANSMALSDNKRFPLLYRTCYSESIGNPARLALLKRYGWERVATIVQNEGLFTLTMVDLRKLLDKENFTVLTAETLTSDPMYQVRNLKSKDSRIIIGMFYSNMARKVFCAAHKLGMYGKQYQWIIPGWFDARWWEVRDDGLECTPAQIKLAAGNYFAAMEATWSSDPRPTINGQSAPALNKRYAERVKTTPYTPNEYCVFAYDAIWAVALALNKSIETLRAQGKSLEQFNFNDSSMAHIFQEKLQGLHYRGMSGEIAFDKFGDRVGVVVIEQLQDDGEVSIAEYNSHTNTLQFNNNQIIWQGGSPPVDHTHITLELLSVSLALMIFMTVIAVLGIVLATGFLAFNIYYSDRRFIRMSSPRLNSITVIGCILIYLSVIFAGISDGRFITPSQYTSICQIQIWIICIGFTLAYGAMFSKTWRVHILFLRKIERRTPRCFLSHQQPGNMLYQLSFRSLQSIKDHQLLALVAGLLLIDVIILITWQVVDPLHYAERYLPVIEDGNGLSARKPYIEFCSCQHSVKWKGTIFTFKGLLLIFGAFLAWETRNVTIPALNDSKNIGISVYTVVLSCTVGLPVIMVITNMPDFTYGLSCAMCLACTTITLCLMFLPKITRLGKPDLEQKDTQTERFYGTKNNAVVPSDSKTTSSIHSAQKEPESPLDEPQKSFSSIRKNSRVVTIKEEPKGCNNLEVEISEVTQEADQAEGKDATESKP